MYKRLLVPTDGSELATEAVRGAVRFAKPFGASVVLITVMEPYSYTSLSEYRPESIEDYDERMRETAEENLQAVVDAVLILPVGYRTLTRDEVVDILRESM